MIVVPFHVTLLEPLLATRIAGDPNSSVSYPYVPGSMVRGAAVTAYLRNRQLPSLDAGNVEARRLFFDSHIRYLNAYPIDAEGHRTLPTPRSLFNVKGEGGPLFDFAHEVIHEIGDQKAQFVAASKESQPFCWIEDDRIHFVSPQRRVNVHTMRDREKGRATRDDGAVFQYDALEAGQTFSGWALADTKEDVTLLTSLLHGIQRFGGSSNSGYGRVAVEVGVPIEIAQKPWREAPGSHDEISAEAVFIVTLLSDALIRDPETGHNTWDVRPALQEALGAAIEHIQSSEDEERRGVWRLEELGGFNRTWGLPLPQMQAIAAGSVFVFRAKEPISKQAIAAVEWQGIGERRAEGFGRLAFDWQPKSELAVVDAPVKPPKGSLAIQLSDGPARTLGAQMAERMLRQELATKLRKTIYGIRIQPNPAISNAQLSRMRVVVREALSNGDVERVKQYLTENVDKRRPVRDQFDRTRVGGERLSHWLEERLTSPETVWAKIGAQNLSKRIGANVEVAAQGNEALAREYTLRLIDGVLARLAKERRKENGGDR
jgi:CRISPR-associated protein Csx10